MKLHNYAHGFAKCGVRRVDNPQNLSYKVPKFMQFWS